MRLTILAIVALPVSGFAQEAAVPAPADTLAQSQSCPVGMVWDGAAQNCAIGGDEASPVQSLPGGMGCSGHGAAREVTS